MLEIFSQYAMQMIWGLGILLLFGVLLELATKQFLANTGKGGRRFFIATGFIGTPVHELSHAAMCLLFGHRIKRICLFSPNSRTGTLGYVEHAYQKNNLYQRAGNFFIGIAPMLGGSAVMILLIGFLLPNTFLVIGESASVLYAGDFSPFAPATYQLLFETMGRVLAALFTPTQLGNPLWWVFIVLALMIAMHLDISPADLRTAMVGFWIFSLLLLALDAVLYYTAPAALAAFTTACLSISTLVLVLILPAVVLIVAALLVSYLFRICR